MTWLARAVFVLLVGATFAAFFVAQRLKGAPPVVEVRGLARFFSPNADGYRDVNGFSVRLSEADDVTVDIVDPDGDTVRRLAAARPVRPYRPLRLTWDGRSDAGSPAPDGAYRVRLSLRRQGRSVTVPKTMRLDTQPPRPIVTRIEPGQIVGPRAPEMQVFVRGVSPRTPTRFRVLRTDDGRPREVAAGERSPGLRRWTWDGRVDGEPAPPGVYVVEVSVRDRAGNVGTVPTELPPPPGATVGRPGITVRALAAQPPVHPVTAGSRVEFFVDSRRRPYRWSVRRPGAPRPVKRGREAAGTPRPLAFTAPDGRSGLYVLDLRTGEATAKVPFLVQGRERADVLVVVPAITWLGINRADDPPALDGVPDTLEDGGPVRWPRLFGSSQGLPRGLEEDVAPLLAFLDRARIRYDLTSDLDLALSRAPRATDRKGVLLAASHRWVTRPLARRLRRYALDGGTLASFGADTLRRGVTLRANGDESAGELTRPTQPTQQDPFGATLSPLRRSGSEPVTLEPLAGSPSFGLLTGSDGVLEGFSEMEESADPRQGSRARMLLGLGRPLPEPDPDAPPDAALPEPAYALTATRLGKGLVLRIGLPEWTRRLDEPEVAQITRNVVDLLRDVRPKIRSTR